MTPTTIRTCTTCGMKNRVRPDSLTRVVRCGSCKTTLPPIAEPLDVGLAAFDDIVSNARVPVLVDFWAEWCGPCRAAAPVLKQVAHDMAGRALVLKVDTEAEPELSTRFRVQAIPNFVVLRDGQVVRQHPGLAPREQIQAWLEQA